MVVLFSAHIHIHLLADVGGGGIHKGLNGMVTTTIIYTIFMRHYQP